MMKKIIIICTIILTALIMFAFLSRVFKNDNAEPKPDNPSSIVLGMVLLKDVQKIDFKKIIVELKHKHGLEITKQEIDEEKGAGVIQLKNSQIAIMLMDLPIPGDELEYPSQISYLWPNAKDLTPTHKAHIIISVSSSTGDSVLNMFKTFTKVASCILTNTNSLGIYLGNQTLVLPTDFYVENASTMTDEHFPLMNWVYFGIREESGKTSGYTFGLKEFGFLELEILNSDYPLEDIQEMLFNVSHYIIQSNVTLNDGETVGLTADQKFKIVKSKGVQLEGTTLKLEY
jgi:hypothetical protein